MALFDSMPDMSGLMTGANDWLKDPANQRALLAFGTQVLQPIPRGGNLLGTIGNSVAAGAGARDDYRAAQASAADKADTRKLRWLTFDREGTNADRNYALGVRREGNSERNSDRNYGLQARGADRADQSLATTQDHQTRQDILAEDRNTIATKALENRGKKGAGVGGGSPLDTQRRVGSAATRLFSQYIKDTLANRPLGVSGPITEQERAEALASAQADAETLYGGGADPDQIGVETPAAPSTPQTRNVSGMAGMTTPAPPTSQTMIAPSPTAGLPTFAQVANDPRTAGVIQHALATRDPGILAKLRAKVADPQVIDQILNGTPTTPVQ